MARTRPSTASPESRPLYGRTATSTRQPAKPSLPASTNGPTATASNSTQLAKRSPRRPRRSASSSSCEPRRGPRGVRGSTSARGWHEPSAARATRSRVLTCRRPTRCGTPGCHVAAVDGSAASSGEDSRSPQAVWCSHGIGGNRRPYGDQRRGARLPRPTARLRSAVRTARSACGRRGHRDRSQLRARLRLGPPIRQ